LSILRDRWQEIRDLANSGVRRLRAQALGTPSHEAAKWREARSRPYEKDRWKISKDLVNSEVRWVRTQTLGIQSREDARREKEDNR